MDLWELRYFVSAAEHLNITKAAESLHISQSALSKKIASLEDHFGVQLFVRGRHSLTLSMAGQVFLRESRAILDRWDQTYNKIHQAASGNIGSLHIGYTGGYVTRLLPQVIRRYHAVAPDVILDVERRNIRILLKGLLEGNLDVAFIVSHDRQAVDPALTCQVLTQDLLMVALPDDHPLAHRPRLSLADLAEEPFVFMARSENHSIFDFSLKLCAAAGFTPNIVNQPTMIETVLMLVASGLGITLFSPLSNAETAQNLRMVPLTDRYPAYLLAVWGKENLNPAIPPFLKTLGEETAT